MQETGVPTQKSGIPKTRKKVGSRMNRCGSPIVVSLDWFLRMEGLPILKKKFTAVTKWELINDRKQKLSKNGEKES